MPGIEGALASYGLLAIFVVMLVKEMGVPLPVPSDLIMITAGVQAAAGAFSLVELFIAIVVAIAVGGSIQFLVARGAGRRLVYRFGRFVGLTAARLDSAAQRVRGRGPLAVFLALNLPGARAGIVVGAGLAGLPYRAFAPALLAGSTVFYGWHVALGYLVGPTATVLFEGLHLPIIPIALVLAGLGLVGWLLLRPRLAAGPGRDVPDRLHSWSEAACPACVALELIGTIRPR